MQAFGASLPSGSEAEIAFISGVTSSATVAATSFQSWSFGSSPATYLNRSSSFKWGSPSLSTSGTPGGTVTYAFDPTSAWTPTEQAALTSGLALWSAEANISFSLTASVSTANFTFRRGTDKSAYESNAVTQGTIGSSTDGSPTATGSFISIDTSQYGFGPLGSFATAGGYTYNTLVHEIGHLIGLGHAGAYNGNVVSSTQQFSAYDSRLWTIMSYIDPSDRTAKYYGSYPVTGTNWGGYYGTTPMMLDILAAQRLYGRATSGPLASGGQIFGFNSNIGGSVGQYFNFTVNSHPVVTLWDGGVNNTLNLSGFSANATINLNPGTFSSAGGLVNNIGISGDTTIETAISGSGSDTIIGSAANNVLDGGLGNDTLTGDAGADTFVYKTGYGLDTITDFNAAEGDRIDLSGYSGIASFASLAQRIAQSGANTLISFATGATLTLRNVSATSISASSFVGLVSSGSQLVYRFYNTQSLDHFYTSNADEAAGLRKNGGAYVYEGTPWATPDKASNTIDVYRFYDVVSNTHFFTTNALERDDILARIPTYHYEGVGFEAYADSSAPSSLTLERFYNKQTGIHHFSASATETLGIRAGSAGPGWVDEGPGFIVAASTSASAEPLADPLAAASFASPSLPSADLSAAYASLTVDMRG
ncbi:MAG: M10 family metallopeptidase C-terminal domain-containing protein [Beijerinckiaceae bacterium]|nr:M10 family metallopeptidase C-terminal domain-containing protein [Beijerinckiaceae bacterium]